MTHPWPLGRVAYGGEYTPEQWPRAVWAQDVELMREAGVTLVTTNVFTWGMLEPREGEYDFSTLDEVLDRLHDAGIAVDLATPTAAPPAWFFATYPLARVVTRDGVPLGPGSRGMASPSSPEYRRAAERMADTLARRYAGHPAVALWHVHNEYGAPVAADYSVAAEEAFRVWLQARYVSLDRLNAAWGTTFWGQQYHLWEHVGLPGPTPSVGNPAQQLDFRRFSDHQLRACFIAERDAIRAHAPQPITTNFMAFNCPDTDLWAWAREVDVVSNDHYLVAAETEPEIGLAMAADLTRSVAGGAPWVLMEHSTSAVNWQPRNIAKRPGEMRRNSLAHVARGADAVLFFQWRASRSGAEKFHSAMLPHGGTGTRVWRAVVELGEDVAALAEIAGSRVAAEVAVLWDFESAWAQDLPWHPSVDLDAHERTRAYYERLWRDGLTVDFAHPEADLSGYRLVLAPASYLLTAAAAANLREYVDGGGTLVLGCFSGVVDENDAVHDGGFLAPLRDVVGVSVEEYLPLREGASTTIQIGATTASAGIWQEAVTPSGAEVIGVYRDGQAATSPAITRNRYGSGTAWYVSTCPDVASLAAVLAGAYRDAGVTPRSSASGVEVVTRQSDDASFTFVINHTASEAVLPADDTGHALLGRVADGVLAVAAGGVGILRTAASSRHIDDSLQSSSSDPTRSAVNV